MTQPKSRGRTLIIIAVGLALLTFCITFNFLTSLQPQPQMVSVVKIKANVPARTVLDSAFLQNTEVVPMPVEYAPTSRVDPSQLRQLALAANDTGAVTLVTLQAGDILQANQIDVSRGLAPEMRAVSIAVDQVTSVGGTVREGSRVDVIVSYEQEDAQGKKSPRTILLLSNVEVLAVFINSPYSSVMAPLPGATPQAGSVAAGPQPARFSPEGAMMKDTTVTLALTLRDAMRLTYMANFAKEVRLVLRRPDEKPLQSPMQPVDPNTFK